MTKKGTVRSKTTEIIKRLLPREIVASWEYAIPRHRSRKNMSYEMLGIHEDPNGALINNIEEYGPSTSSSDNSFKENVVFYGVSKSMC